MTRTQLQKHLQKITGLSDHKIKLFLDSFIDLLVQKAKDREDILISGLGSFKSKVTRARSLKDFNNPTVVINIPEKAAFKFFSSPTLKQTINKALREKQGLEINITNNTSKKTLSEETIANIDEKPLKIKFTPSLVKSVETRDNLSSHIRFKYIPHEVLKIIPPYIARTYKIVPMELEEGTLKAAISSSTTSAAIGFLKQKVGLNIEPIEVSEIELMHLINRYGDIGAHPLRQYATGEIPSRILKDALISAISKKSGLLIIEPKSDDAHISIKTARISQILYSLSKAQYQELVTRIKDLALLDSNINNIIQKNSIKYTFSGQKLDLNITCLPTIEGEKIIIEIDNLNDFSYSLDNIGLLKSEVETVKERFSKKGLILITGTPKSGKTTTAYAMIKELSENGKFIVTYEEKVKKIIPNVTQTEFDPKIGYWGWMDSVMKLDPDCIFISNINHPEAAKAAFHAACGGYLVIATINSLGTNNLLEKLSNYKIESHLILNGLSLVIYQKLVSALCSDCSKVTNLTRQEAQIINNKINKLPIVFRQSLPRSLSVYESSKCFFCGHDNEILEPIYEILPVDDVGRQKLGDKISRARILKIFREHELITLKQDALIKSLLGKISYQTYKEQL